MTNQLQRIVVAAIAIPLAVALIWLSGLPLVALVAVVAGLGTAELFGLAERSGMRPLRPLGIVLAVLTPLLTWVVAGPLADPLNPIEGFVAGVLGPLWLWVQWPLLALIGPLVILSAVLLTRAPNQRPLEAASVTLLGPVYCALMPATLLVMRFAAGPERSWPATWLLLYPLVITWACDSFAMWGGKAMGGPKLWPSVSPGKTQSGGVAGLAGGVVAAVLYVPLVLTPTGRPIPLVQAALFGLVISVVAQLGDLVESLFKRAAGVKDASSLIPGHGGVLDRFDSLYFVLPVAALLFRAFGIL